MILENLVEDLIEYTEESRDVVMMKMNASTLKQRARWLSMLPDSRHDFYDTDDQYLYDLTKWHTTDSGRQLWTSRIVKFVEQMNLKTILDFGCGIGTDGLTLAELGHDVDLIDVNAVCSDFVKWKVEKYNLATTSTAKRLQNYDLGICIDVIAHLEDPFEALLNLSRWCKYLFLSEDWQTGDNRYPMHNVKPKRWNTYRESLFADIGGGFYRSKILLPVVTMIPGGNENVIGGVLRHSYQLSKELQCLGAIVNHDKAIESDIMHCHALDNSPNIDVYTNHGFYGRDVVQHAKLNEIMEANIAGSFVNTAVAKYTANRYSDRLRVNTMVIPNGVDLEELNKIPRGEFKATHNLPSYFLWGKNTVNAVCDPVPAQMLAKLMLDQSFVFTLTHGAITANIKQIGVLPYHLMLRCIADAEVLVATTRENCSIQVIEAMALGTPVLAFADGGNQELVVHRETGYLAKPGDYTDLLQGARFCKENRDRLSTASLERAKQYDWKSIAEDTLAIYNQIIELKAERATQTKCSIVITSYNQKSIISTAIDSALKQQFDDFEVIVVDDASTDGSPEYLTEQYDDKIKLITRSKNGGVSATRNTGIKEANSEFITCLDGDDKLEPDFLSTLYPMISRDNRVGVVYSNFFRFGIQSGTVRMPDYNRDEIVKTNQIPCCNIFRKTAWEKAGGYKSHLTAWEDWDLWLSISELGYLMVHSEKPLWSYRIMPGTGRTFDTKNKTDIIRSQIRKNHTDTYRPMVSIIIPCYKQEKYLRDSIGSLSLQTIKDFEIIVVDDGSDADVEGETRRLSEKYHYDIRCILHSENKGLASARNTGVLAARGRYICCLDADDMLASNYLEVCSYVLDTRPDISIVYTDIEFFGAVSDIHRLPDYDFELLVRKNLMHCSAMYRKNVFEEVGGYNANMKWGWEDYDFWVGAGEHGYCGIRVPEPLFMYRRMPGSMIVKAQEHLEDMRRQLYANHQISYGGLRTMGCCGRVSTMPVKKMQRVDEPTLRIGEATLVEVKYLGSRFVTLRGKTSGAYYQFSRESIGYVDSRDLDGLFKDAQFERTIPMENVKEWTADLLSVV